MSSSKAEAVVATGNDKRTWLKWGLGLLLLVVAPYVFYPVLLMKMLCFGIFACAFNVVLGYGGLLSFGHAAFFGLSAYVAGYALKDLQLATPIGLLLGTLSAVILGWVIGSVAIRRQGIYFTMTTLALAQMMYFFFIKAKFTGGEDGMQGVPRGTMFGLDLSDDLNLYYFVALVFCFAFVAIYRLVHSPFGQVLKAIRENESRAISLGFDVTKYKLLAFVISAGLAGMAGSTKVLVFRLASLTDAHWHASGEVVLMTLVGGVGTLLGPLVGASVIVALQNQLADKVGSYVTVIMGVIFILCVLVFRRGIVGEITALYHRAVGERVK